MGSDPEKAKALVQGGAEIAGACVGGALGFIAGGPGYAAAAGVLGVLVTKSLAHTADKVMSHRERIRVGSVAAIAVACIGDRISRGDVPRPDFFSQESLDSDGEQLLEGVLLKARDEYEEKKLPYLGRFYANLVFSPTVSPATAALLIKTLERLTFRQMVLLSLVLKQGQLDVEHLRSQEHSNSELEALKREEMDLHTSDLGYMGLIRGAGLYVDELSSLGATLAELSGFADVPDVESQQIKALLSKCSINEDIHFWSNRNADS